MASEGDEPGALFDPFSAAEAACEEAIDTILTEGGRLLYESYIERKSFSFASDAVSHVLVSELKMCFVRCDGGEPPQEARPEPPPERPVRDGWAMEPEPVRCRIDTWARSCVPVRRKLVRPKVATAEDPRRRGRAKASSASNASVGRSPSRQGGTTNSLEQSEFRGTAPKSQMIPLMEEHEEDEEEAVMRDMKEREARRKREEEARQQKKAAEEAEEAARLAQVKDQMKNKPFTYDSNGNIIWVQPLKTNKLPTTNPAPAYSFKKDVAAQDPAGKPPAGRGQKSDLRGTRKRQEVRQEKEFTDSFKKFTAQQPSMMEVMTMAPGVELAERGLRKKGDNTSARGRSGAPLTRKDYEDMVRGGSGYKGDPVEGSSAHEGSPLASARSNSVAPGDEDGFGAEVKQPLLPTGGAEGDTRDGLQNIRKLDLGAELVPRPPASRPVQPVAPPTFRRVQMKRDALGYAMSTRERVATGTASRYPNCAAQPPLGATMGHGLAPVGQKQEEYYFPQAGAPNAMSSIGGEEASVPPGSAPTSARGTGGQIVSRNPELARRLFPR